MLGHHPDVVGVGEVGRIWALGWTRPWPCACGADVGRCPFWSAVRSDVEAALGRDSIIEGARMQERERLHALVAPPPKVWRARWADLQAALYGAIRRAAGKPVVCDSTKAPTRLWWLRQGGLDPSIVHLVRGLDATVRSVGRGLDAAAEGRQPAVGTKGPLRTTVEWWGTHAAARLAGAGAGALALRHEWWTSAPVPAITALAMDLGLDPQPLAGLLSAQRPLSPSHQVGGNPMRFQREISIRPSG